MRPLALQPSQRALAIHGILIRDIAFDWRCDVLVQAAKQSSIAVRLVRWATDLSKTWWLGEIVLILELIRSRYATATAIDRQIRHFVERFALNQPELCWFIVIVGLASFQRVLPRLRCQSRFKIRSIEFPEQHLKQAFQSHPRLVVGRTSFTV